MSTAAGRITTASFAGDAYLETAVSAALLRRIARGELPATARLNRTGPILAFGKLDRLRPGYRRAVEIAEAAGYAPVERIAGGRAAVFHHGTISLSVASRADGPGGAYRGTRERFAALARLIADALAGVGVEARVGAVAGEYCPGEFSVNARDAVKLAGIGQRVVAGGAHVGAVIVVRGAGAVNAVLGPVYDALELDFDPDATGSVARELGERDEPRPPADPDPLIDALASRLRAGLERDGTPVEVEVDPVTLELAERIKGDYRPR
ncbi:MAG: lipoate--protein ligase family protein [Thermoleophilia bacterium]|nr:lipoate--protein ligase family protein [Thermoleophilia bacterium]